MNVMYLLVVLLAGAPTAQREDPSESGTPLLPKHIKINMHINVLHFLLILLAGTLLSLSIYIYIPRSFSLSISLSLSLCLSAATSVLQLIL